VLILGTPGTHFGVFGVFPEAQKIVLADRQLEAEPREFALHVLVAVSGGENAAFGIALLHRDLFQRLLCLAQFCVHLRQSGLCLAHLMFEPQDFSVESPQLALHAERTGFIRAPAGDHPALVASAVRRDESELRIVARERLGGRCAVRQIGRPQARKKLLGGGAERIAEAHQLVEAGDYAVFHAEVDDGLVLG